MTMFVRMIVIADVLFLVYIATFFDIHVSEKTLTMVAVAVLVAIALAVVENGRRRRP